MAACHAVSRLRPSSFWREFAKAPQAFRRDEVEPLNAPFTMNPRPSSLHRLLGVLTLSFLVVSNLHAADGPPPKGWGGTPMDEYRRGVDSEVTREGKPSVFIESIKGNASGFGTMTQGFIAADYLGKRVRFKGYVKTRDVTGRGAGLWMRVDDVNKRTLIIDNMDKRTVSGTSDWTEVSIVADIPQHAESFLIGVLLSGKGRMWVSGLTFEIVDSSVPVTATAAEPAPRRKPENLSFTE
jgi:hypothetical protein